MGARGARGRAGNAQADLDEGGEDVSNQVGEYDPGHTTAVVFPLGGIGTGSIGLAGNGRLVEFEIQNRPNKNSSNGFSFFAIKAEHAHQVRTAKILNGDLEGTHSGEGRSPFVGFGFGPPREALAGLPHYAQWHFTGRFPVAQIAFADQDRMLDVTLSAFNPFVPLNSEDSSLPVALFTFDITNCSAESLEVTLVGALQNPFGGMGINRVVREAGLHQLMLMHSTLTPADTQFGHLLLATDGGDVSPQTYWYRGDWFDNLEVFWREFSGPGRIRDRRYDGPRSVDSVYDDGDVGVLAQHAAIRPGDTARLRFLVAWYFPWYVNYWNPGGSPAPRWKNYYATRFESASAVAAYAFQHWDRLEAQTGRFRDAFFDSTMPAAVLDRVSANLSVLKSPTVARLTDGTLYGFEGCHADSGCCEGSCTHVWNYDQATPFLFPDLARSMREAAYRHGVDDAGRMAFRLLLPLERTRAESTHRAAVDGQMGEIIKVYREWKVSGDTQWLARLWPTVRRSLEYAWSPDNPDGWDADCDGVLEGVQHHTLDVEFYGPNAYLTGFYLAALAAAGEMAAALGEASEEYRRLGRQGRAWVTTHLFNGEYFIQQVSARDAALPLDPELGEVKYQLGDGCHIDQVIGQWHARLVGLGDILDQSQVHSALRAVHRFNFRSMRAHANVHRVFALNDERGVVIATWPRGGAPQIPVPYHGECMTGYEYEVASHMIYEGLVDEGLEVVNAIRDRYDGRHRNPWNEIECGSHYARALASYGLWLALSGFEYDMRRHHMGFHPRIHPAAFRAFWSLNTAWGVFRWEGQRVSLEVFAGHLSLQSFSAAGLDHAGSVAVRMGAPSVVPEFAFRGGVLRFATAVHLQAGDALVVDGV